VSGGLGLGRDISARDLGLTSLDLMQRRLTNAQSLGQSQLGGQQFNATMGQQADTTNAQLGQQNSQFNAGQRNSALQTDAQLQQQNSQFNTGQRNSGLQFDSGQMQQANQFGANNNLNLAQLMSQLNNQDFSKFLAASQFGQQLQAPVVGLDPSAIANLAVGNTNAATQAGLNAAGIKAQGANNLTNFGGQLFGYGFGNMGNYGAAGKTSPSPTGYYTPQGNVGVQTDFSKAFTS